MSADRSAADVHGWLRSESPKHLELLTKLREKLAESVAVDVNKHGTPSRDWNRSYHSYQAGFTALITEERERVKLRLMATKRGEELLSDDEYAAGLKELASESLATLPDAELHAELARRAKQLTPAGQEQGDGPDDA